TTIFLLPLPDALPLSLIERVERIPLADFLPRAPRSADDLPHKSSFAVPLHAQISARRWRVLDREQPDLLPLDARLVLLLQTHARSEEHTSELQSPDQP